MLVYFSKCVKKLANGQVMSLRAQRITFTKFAYLLKPKTCKLRTIVCDSMPESKWVRNLTISTDPQTEVTAVLR